MRRFFRWLGDKIRESIIESEPDDQWGNSMSARLGSGHQLSQDNTLTGGMSFTLHRANGGMVVEHSYYDNKTDDRHQSIHIITDDQNLGDSLAKIVTIELLRR